MQISININKKIELNDCIFIPSNVASSKNGKVWTGEMLISSELVQKYKAKTKKYFTDESLKNKFKEQLKGKRKPYKIGFYIVRDSLRRWDFHNIVQLPFDLMVEHGWLEDDNTKICVPVFLGEHKDKENPGMYITVL